ncbi:hypothetical protein [Streptomyces sp. 3N207]|uniref:hypothetical protein n=1 Tax=Streptomyces sp. 3N207 TaxID=3457417 RepID=UPI003FD3F8F9
MLNDARVEGAQRAQDGHQRLERGHSCHVPALVLSGQEHGHDQAGDLALVRLLAQGAADGLDDVDGAAAHVGEQHTVQTAPIGDIGPLPQQAAGGQDPELRLTALRVHTACELVEDSALVGGRVEAAQPLPPHLTREPPGARSSSAASGRPRAKERASWVREWKESRLTTPVVSMWARVAARIAPSRSPRRSSNVASSPGGQPGRRLCRRAGAGA